MLFHGLVFKPWRIWTRRPLWLKTLLGMLIGIGIGLGFNGWRSCSSPSASCS